MLAKLRNTFIEKSCYKTFSVETENEQEMAKHKALTKMVAKQLKSHFGN